MRLIISHINNVTEKLTQKVKYRFINFRARRQIKEGNERRDKIVKKSNEGGKQLRFRAAGVPARNLNRGVIRSPDTTKVRPLAGF